MTMNDAQAIADRCDAWLRQHHIVAMLVCAMLAPIGAILIFVVFLLMAIRFAASAFKGR